MKGEWFFDRLEHIKNYPPRGGIGLARLTIDDTGLNDVRVVVRREMTRFGHSLNHKDIVDASLLPYGLN